MIKKFQFRIFRYLLAIVIFGIFIGNYIDSENAELCRMYGNEVAESKIEEFNRQTLLYKFNKEAAIKSMNKCVLIKQIIKE